MYSVNHDELKQMAKLFYERRKPLFIWGAPGIGKSVAIREFANNMGLNFVDIRLSQIDPTDLRGLPKLDGERTKWLPPNWLPDEGKGIIFVDELNLAPPSIQAAAYELVYDRKIGDYVLPEDWVVFAAGNRSEDRAHTFEMAAPLANRFAHIELATPYIDPNDLGKGWTAWAMNKELDTRIINFLIKNTSMLFKFDSKIKEKAFPTPRTWEITSDLIKGTEDLAMIQMISSSTVGEGVATQFAAFLKTSRKIDLKKILEQPKLVKEIKDVDLKYGLVNEITNWYQNKKPKNYVEKLVPILENLDPEFSIRILQISDGIGKTHFKKALVADKNSDALMTKYADYFF